MFSLVTVYNYACWWGGCVLQWKSDTLGATVGQVVGSSIQQFWHNNCPCPSAQTFCCHSWHRWTRRQQVQGKTWQTNAFALKFCFTSRMCNKNHLFLSTGTLSSEHVLIWFFSSRSGLIHHRLYRQARPSCSCACQSPEPQMAVQFDAHPCVYYMLCVGQKLWLELDSFQKFSLQSCERQVGTTSFAFCSQLVAILSSRSL